MLTLRPYQEHGVQQLREAFRAGARAPLYQLPTGGGKTVVFTHISEQASARGNHIWILVHRQELLFQCSRALEGLGIPHGLVAPGFTPARELVQVCSVQTAVRRIEQGRMGPVDLIVIDEAHHATAGSWKKIITARPDARLLGVTATPMRTDGQGLGKHAGGVFDALVLGPTVAELIRDGFLSKPVVYAPPSQLDLSGIRMRGGDYAQNELAQRVDKPKITGDAVEHYRRLCPGKPAIAFCASVEHAKHVAAQFRAAGFRSDSIDGGMDDTRRKALIDALGNGGMHVLTSCEIVSEGTDIPVVAAAILLRPTASTVLYLQQVGRALRPAPGKDKALILDHVANVMVHGLPDEDRPWSLDGVPKAKGKRNGAPNVAVKICPECFAAHTPANTCPSCGYVYQPELIAPQQVDGQLTEITAEQAAAMKLERQKLFKRAQTKDELEAVAQRFGYSAKWVEVTLRKKQQARKRWEKNREADFASLAATMR